MNVFVNFVLMTAGTFVGLMVASLLAVASEADDKNEAYQAGYRKGLQDGRKESQKDDH